PEDHVHNKQIRTFLACPGEQGEFVMRPITMIRTRVRVAATMSVTVLLVGGCGDVSREGTPGVSAPPGTVVQVHKDVAFYPACGNEVLNLNGTKWYQLLPEEQRALREDPDDADSMGPALPEAFMIVRSSAPPLPGPQRTPSLGIHVPAVVAPGRGDDIGDVTVFGDGLARFESDSGDLTTWLTREKRTYNWVC
ncbi:hypothetical protein, partial [Serinicoccus profundi]|uniref:hypothetical protein n=1 Tax=Serinicoccus profundi TaxID=1078471 RepID=UPI000255EF11